MSIKSSKKDLYFNPDIFARNKEDSAKTMMIVGRSYSGKTHFLVSEMNKLIGKKREDGRPFYDLIVFFTESVDADPLKKLEKGLNVVTIKGYVPRIVQLLKRIQDASQRSFRFLVILDDVVTGIRSGTFLKQILTMRNSQISTCILIQYVKLITPAQRNSIHQMYITGIKPEEWEYLIKGFLQSHARELVGNIPNISKLAFELKKWIDSDIFVYDQRKDKVSLIQRDVFN